MPKAPPQPRAARFKATEIPVGPYLYIDRRPRALQQEPPLCEPGFVYTVRPGDTLSRLEEQLGVRAEDIIAANPHVTNFEELMEGQQICIPFVEPATCPSGFLVEVEEGETLASIAQEFEVSIDEIIALNPQLANPERILPGFLLCMPEGALESQIGSERVELNRYQYRDETWTFGVSTVRRRDAR